jgi:hypothetical protein
MNLPLVAFDAGGQSRAGLEAQIQVDEVKRTTDPRDTGNDVQSAKDGACRFSEY